MNYAERLARTEAQVDALQVQLDTMAMQQQPRAKNSTNNSVYQTAMGHPPGYGSQQDYGFYMLQQQTTQGPHPDPFGNQNEWATWSQAGQQSSESTKRRRVISGNEQPEREYGNQSRGQPSG